MPLRGEAANKFGIGYEILWTARCLIDVMAEKSSWIHLVPAGKEGTGVEFKLSRSGTIECHQVKRQQSNKGYWSLADLDEENVLSHFRDNISSQGNVCVFVSTQSAHPLAELSERAATANSFSEYEHGFLTNKKLQQGFEELCHRWSLRKEEGYLTLRSIRIEPIGEKILTETTEALLDPLVEGNPKAILDTLRAMAIDLVHKQLHALDIWQFLEKRGFSRRQWGSDPKVLTAVETINRRHLFSLEEMALAGRLIPREETSSILQMLTHSSMKRVVLVSGEAGSGKSLTLLQTAKALVDKGTPVLGFRADRLDPTQHPEAVGKQLGLPGSPASVLAAITHGRPGVLILDQLDAVSLVSGRKPEFFDCLDEIVRQALTHPEMKVLISCRKFDLDNDHRFRRLTCKEGLAETINVSRLTLKTVREVLTTLGYDCQRLNNAQMELLTLPAHLNLLAEIAKGPGVKPVDFRTAKELYDLFWDRKRLTVKDRLSAPDQWSILLGRLTELMSERQTLSIPYILLDSWRQDVEVLLSENVLIQDGTKLALFHEGFFDYVFARRFAEGENDLPRFILSSEQGLFRRAQLRQILLWRRDADPPRYLRDLKALLTNPGTRFHLRQAIFDFLGSLADPSQLEWEIIATFLVNKPRRKKWGLPFSLNSITRWPKIRQMCSLILKDNIIKRALYSETWKVVGKSPAWFNLLDLLGLPEQWLADDDEEIRGWTLRLLQTAYERFPDRVAELLEPFWGRSKWWNDLLGSYLLTLRLGLNQRLFDLFIRLADEGALDGKQGFSQNSSYLELLHPLENDRPDWASRAIGHYLSRGLALLGGEEKARITQDDNFLGHHCIPERMILDSANNDPEAFIREVLPSMVSILKAAAVEGDEIPRLDYIWLYRMQTGIPNSSRALLTAMETALSALATNKPADFLRLAGELKFLEFDTLHYLLLRAFTENAGTLAIPAVEYLLENPLRLTTGMTGESGWAIQELLAAVTLHCPDSLLEALQRTILDDYPRWAIHAEKGRHDGWPQLPLLRGIVLDRRSPAAVRRLAELERRFGTAAIQPPQLDMASEVLSPITESAIDRMTDEQWLRAISKYSSDTFNQRSDGKLSGGVLELSRELERVAEVDPERFARLASHFPDDTHPSYFDAVLQGLATARPAPDLYLDVCRRSYHIPGRPSGRWICSGLQKMADLDWPSEMIEILIWYALKDPDPQKEEWREPAPSGGYYYRGDPYFAGINSVRGEAARAIAKLLEYHGNLADTFKPVLVEMAHDPSVAARSCVAAALTGLLKHDRSTAVKLFLQLTEAEDILLGAPTSERFLLYAANTHFHSLSPLLHRMLRSNVEAARRSGARIVCLAALVEKDAQKLVRRSLKGDEIQRTGAAEVYAANLSVASFRRWCEKILADLFTDKSATVRSAASQCFYKIKGENAEEFDWLIDRYTTSRACVDGCTPLLQLLENVPQPKPETVFLICQRILIEVGTEISDIRLHPAIDSEKLCKLLLRVYEQAQNDRIQNQALDLIDWLFSLHAYGIEKIQAYGER